MPPDGHDIERADRQEPAAGSVDPVRGNDAARGEHFPRLAWVGEPFDRRLRLGEPRLVGPQDALGECLIVDLRHTRRSSTRARRAVAANVGGGTVAGGGRGPPRRPASLMRTSQTGFGTTRVFCVAPGSDQPPEQRLLARHRRGRRIGGRGRPADLNTHTCIAFVIPSTGRVQPWSFHPEPAEYLPKASYRVGDDVLALVTLARAGIGLIQTYDFVVAQDVARGALVEVLSAHRGVSRPFSLIYPRGVTQSRATRAMIEFILEMERAR